MQLSSTSPSTAYVITTLSKESETIKSGTTSLAVAFMRLLSTIGSIGTWILRITLFCLQPVSFGLHLVYLVMRPVIIVLQVLVYFTIKLPYSILKYLAILLYPIYLFLGTAATIGIVAGIVGCFVSWSLGQVLGKGISLAERQIQGFFSSPEPKDPLSLPAVVVGRTGSVRGGGGGSGRDARKAFMSRRGRGKRGIATSVPSTRSIYSSQPPTINEDTEHSDLTVDYDGDSSEPPSEPNDWY